MIVFPRGGVLSWKFFLHKNLCLSGKHSQAINSDLSGRFKPSINRSLRTSDRCHWCGNPPQWWDCIVFLTINVWKFRGLPRQCAHWLAMTSFFQTPRQIGICWTARKMKSQIRKVFSLLNPLYCRTERLDNHFVYILCKNSGIKWKIGVCCRWIFYICMC